MKIENVTSIKGYKFTELDSNATITFSNEIVYATHPNNTAVHPKEYQSNIFRIELEGVNMNTSEQVNMTIPRGKIDYVDGFLHISPIIDAKNEELWSMTVEE